MEHPKFILTNTGHLRLGMVEMHMDLLLPGEDCLGGGYYEFDYVGNRLILSGKSYDFGKPRWEKIDILKVPAAYRGLRIIYVPDHSWEDDFVVSNEMNIVYN